VPDPNTQVINAKVANKVPKKIKTPQEESEQSSKDRLSHRWRQGKLGALEFLNVLSNASQRNHYHDDISDNVSYGDLKEIARTLRKDILAIAATAKRERPRWLLPDKKEQKAYDKFQVDMKKIKQYLQLLEDGLDEKEKVNLEIDDADLAAQLKKLKNAHKDWKDIYGQLSVYRTTKHGEVNFENKDDKAIEQLAATEEQVAVHLDKIFRSPLSGDGRNGS
jgi:hypothetical protein